MMDEQTVWKKSVCPLCRGGVTRRLMKFNADVSMLPVPDSIVGAGLGLVRCQTCSLVYLEHLPTRRSMEKIYASEQYFGCDGQTGYTDYQDQEASLAKTFQSFLKNICQRLNISGDMADIGCGNGYLLKAAKPWFSRRVGSDMSQSAVDQASLVCDKAFCGGPQQISEADFSDFDLVTAVSVLEHLYDPLEFMQHCRKLVKPGGYIVLAVPHFGSFWRKVMGRSWISFKIPEHLSYWERKSLKQLGRRAGLRLVGFMPYPHYFPLSVVLGKLGLGGGRIMEFPLVHYHILLPGVMLTAVYRK